MKNLLSNNKILGIVLEIVICIILIVISFPSDTKNKQLNEYQKTINYYKKEKIITNNNGDNISVQNISNKTLKYNLVISLPKGLKVNYNDLVFVINDVKYKITNLKSYDDQYNNYYILDTINIDKYSTIKYDFKILLNNKVNDTIKVSLLPLQSV